MKEKKSFVFIGILICISICLFGIYFLVQQNGEKVKITVGKEVYGTYPLHKDQTIKVEVDEGEYNIIQIKDDTVDVIEATCENQICVHDYPISKDTPGVIVCLPHELIVEIIE